MAVGTRWLVGHIMCEMSAIPDYHILVLDGFPVDPSVEAASGQT